MTAKRRGRNPATPNYRKTPPPVVGEEIGAFEIDIRPVRRFLVGAKGQLTLRLQQGGVRIVVKDGADCESSLSLRAASFGEEGDVQIPLRLFASALASFDGKARFSVRLIARTLNGKAVAVCFGQGANTLRLYGTMTEAAEKAPENPAGHSAVNADDLHFSLRLVAGMGSGVLLGRGDTGVLSIGRFGADFVSSGDARCSHSVGTLSHFGSEAWAKRLAALLSLSDAHKAARRLRPSGRPGGDAETVGVSEGERGLTVSFLVGGNHVVVFSPKRSDLLAEKMACERAVAWQGRRKVGVEPLDADTIRVDAVALASLRRAVKLAKAFALPFQRLVWRPQLIKLARTADGFAVSGTGEEGDVTISVPAQVPPSLVGQESPDGRMFPAIRLLAALSSGKAANVRLPRTEGDTEAVDVYLGRGHVTISAYTPVSGGAQH